MRRLKAQTTREKCKYKRCTYKRTNPIEKPRYCPKHWQLLKATYKEPVARINIKQVRQEYLANLEEKEEKLSIAKRIKSFIFVEK